MPDRSAKLGSAISDGPAVQHMIGELAPRHIRPSILNPCRCILGPCKPWLRPSMTCSDTHVLRNQLCLLTEVRKAASMLQCRLFRHQILGVQATLAVVLNPFM